MDDRIWRPSQNQVKSRSAAVERGYRRSGWRSRSWVHVSTPFFQPIGFSLPAIHVSPPHAPPPAPPPLTVLLCCQITKWLFACYKQRKQILYRYYIYIEMFFPRWDVCIGTDITLIHTLRQYSFNAPQSYIRLHTCTLLLTVTCWKSWTKHTFYPVENDFKLLDVHHAIVFCYEIAPFFLFFNPPDFS